MGSLGEGRTPIDHFLFFKKKAVLLSSTGWKIERMHNAAQVRSWRLSPDGRWRHRRSQRRAWNGGGVKILSCVTKMHVDTIAGVQKKMGMVQLKQCSKRTSMWRGKRKALLTKGLCSLYLSQNQLELDVTHVQQWALCWQMCNNLHSGTNQLSFAQWITEIVATCFQVPCKFGNEMAWND